MAGGPALATLTLGTVTLHCGAKQLATTSKKQLFANFISFSNASHRQLPLFTPVLSGNRIMKRSTAKCLLLPFNTLIETVSDDISEKKK